MKKYIFIFVLLFLTYYSQALWANAWGIFWIDKITNNLKFWWDNLIQTSDNMLWYLIWLFYFIAVVIWIYWGFQILVSWWDDEKVKKWKNYVIYMIIWLIIVFLASQIVHWVIKIMNKTST